MDRTLLREFWNCGDNEIIEFALARARLNRKERDVIFRLLDECQTQEEAAGELDISPRNLQAIWYTAADKLLSIPWVYSFAVAIREKE